MDLLSGWIEPPADRAGDPRRRGGPRGLRSYVIEAHSGIPDSGGSRDEGWEMDGTGLDGTKIMRVRAGGAVCEFYADVSDKRFPVLHTAAGRGEAERAVDLITSVSDLPLDRMWLPGSMMDELARDAGGCTRGTDGHVAGACGRPGEDAWGRAEGSLCKGAAARGGSRPGLGGEAGRPAGAGASGAGCLETERGASVLDHLRLVGEARERYRSVVGRMEECRLGWLHKEGNWTFEGSPLCFDFGEPVGDLRGLVGRLLDSARPFRLWGLESEVDRGYYSVAGIDLHAGDPLNFEIAAGMMRVYLAEEGCGNTAMRILCNLQGLLGSRVRCRQVDMAAGG